MPTESKVLGSSCGTERWARSQGWRVSDRQALMRSMDIDDAGLVLMDKDALDAIRTEGGVGQVRTTAR